LIAAPLLVRHHYRSSKLLAKSFYGVDELHQCHVCWMAESGQLPPLARMNVHNSVTLSPPAAFDGASARALESDMEPPIRLSDKTSSVRRP
jgi:hypothetical protein